MSKVNQISVAESETSLIDLTDSLSIKTQSSKIRYNSLESSRLSSSLSTSLSSSDTSYSYSYPNPEQGGNLTDSLMPPSSILGCVHPDMRREGMDDASEDLVAKKDSFDDTSKDVSDIEDWDGQEADDEILVDNE